MSIQSFCQKQIIPRRVHQPMSFSDRHLLGRNRYDLHSNRIIPQLAQCMNICVTTDDTATSSQNQQPTDGTRSASGQVITVVDPKLTLSASETFKNLPKADLKRLLRLDRRSLLMRRSSSLGESVIFRSPLPVSGSPPLKAKHGEVKAQSDRGNLTPNSSAQGKRMLLSGRGARMGPRKSLSVTQNSKKSNISLLRERIQRVSKALKTGREKPGQQFTVEDIEKSQPVNSRVEELATKVSPQLALNVAAVVKKPTEPPPEAQATKRPPVPLSRIKQRKRKKPKIEKKKKVNLRNFKQQIPIADTGYMMEVRLAPDMIEKTRKGNIDMSRDPKIRVNYTRCADLRDEYSSYCGQRKTLKNWLFYV